MEVHVQIFSFPDYLPARMYDKLPEMGDPSASHFGKTPKDFAPRHIRVRDRQDDIVLIIERKGWHGGADGCTVPALSLNEYTIVILSGGHDSAFVSGP